MSSIANKPDVVMCPGRDAVANESDQLFEVRMQQFDRKAFHDLTGHRSCRDRPRRCAFKVTLLSETKCLSGNDRTESLQLFVENGHLEPIEHGLAVGIDKSQAGGRLDGREGHEPVNQSQWVGQFTVKSP